MLILGFGFSGILLIYTGLLFRTDGPVWLGFALVIGGIAAEYIRQDMLKHKDADYKNFTEYHQ